MKSSLTWLRTPLVFFLLINTSVAISDTGEECTVQGPTSELGQFGRAVSQRLDLTSELGSLMQNANGQNNRWMAVGAMSGDMTCTVNLIEPPGGCEPRDDQPAIIATNGHCVGLMRNPPNVRIDAPYSADISFNHFQDTTGRTVQAKADRIIYANMNSRDLALLRLNVTYGELKRQGVRPLKIAQRYRPHRMQNVAIPIEGVPEAERFARSSECSSGDRVDLMEERFVWRSQISYSCPASKGSSGSGLFSSETGELMALLNTGIRRDQPGPPCAGDAPCEFGPHGHQSQSRMSYGFDVTFLHQCASSSCEIDVRQPNCPLPGTPQTEPQISSPTNSLAGPIHLEHPIFGSGEFDAYQVKLGPVGQTNCADPSGYIETQEKAFRPRNPPREDGAYVICVRGRRPGQGWQDFRDVRERGVRLDQVPPVARLSTSANGRILTVGTSDTTDPVVGFVFKFARNESECRSANGYRHPPPIWARGLSIEEARGQVICVLGFDGAGNRQPPSAASVYRAPAR